MWVESETASFQCRHSSASAGDAVRVLALLEQTRDRLCDTFPRTADDLTVVLHDQPASLVAASPIVAATWRATDPAARRYVSGWAGRHELHMLSPLALRDRAARASGAERALALAPATLYTRRVIIECNHELARARAHTRTASALRWAWLLEGASRWFSGESRHMRAAVALRLREGERPSFPPSLRDAPLLGSTVIGLLVREEGERAAVELACRLHPAGARAALTKAFGGRPAVHTEGEWRAGLARLAGSG